MEQDKKQSQEYTSGYKQNRLVQGGAYALAVGAGLVKGAGEIEAQAYDKFKKGEGGKQLSEQRNWLRDKARSFMRRGFNSEEIMEELSHLCRDVGQEEKYFLLPEKERLAMDATLLPHSTQDHLGESLETLFSKLEKIDIAPDAKSMPHAKVNRKGARQFHQAIEDWYTANANYIREELDFKSGSWRAKIAGFKEEFEDLSAAKKRKTVFSTALSVGTVIGVYMAGNQVLRLKAANKQQDNHLQELGRRIDSQEQQHTERLDAALGRSGESASR